MEKIFLSCLNFLINSLCFGSLVVHLNVYNHPEVPVFQMNIISIDLLPYNITHFCFQYTTLSEHVGEAGNQSSFVTVML